MNTPHTPGPWHVGMKPGPIIYGPHGEQIADMRSPMLEADEHNANARLIEAAPDLLAALAELVAEFDADSDRAAEAPGIGGLNETGGIAYARTVLARVRASQPEGD